MNKVVEYLKRAFEGRNLEADAEKLGIPVEKLKALVEEGGLISAKFAKELEAAINSIRAKELLAAQLDQAKEEAKATGDAEGGTKAAAVESPAPATTVKRTGGRQGQGSSGNFLAKPAARGAVMY